MNSDLSSFIAMTLGPFVVDAAALVIGAVIVFAVIAACLEIFRRGGDTGV